MVPGTTTAVTSASVVMSTHILPEQVSVGTAMVDLVINDLKSTPASGRVTGSRTTSLLHFLMVVLIVLATGCGNRKDVPTLPDTHPPTWMTQDSPDFHGKVALQDGTQSCAKCHGSDWAGGSTKISCTDCHLRLTDACVTCHGGADDRSGAPPKGLHGEMADTTLAVGAHTKHLHESTLSIGVACNTCHKVPLFVLDSAHFDSGFEGGPLGADSIAEISWHGLATRGGQAEWNRNSRTCGSTYCHGNFVGGNAANVPIWSASNQASCGSCHDVGTNPASLQWKHELHVTSFGLKCADCHANVVDQQLGISGKSLHVNGVVDTLTRDPAVCNVCHGPGQGSCTSCHGGIDNQTGAPPKGLRGETSTTTIAVGAHTAHVQTAAIAGAYDCNQCHIKPTTVASPGHFGLDSLAEVIWGGIAGVSSQWNRNAKTCSSTYCHGNFVGGSASNAPVWTSPNQATCGSCHDAGTNPASLQWKHELHITSFGLKCGDCHANVVDQQLNLTGKNLHVNGVVDTLTRDPAVCNLCHGPGQGSCATCHGGIDNHTGAPPKGLRGETATTTIAVGAHSGHVQVGVIANAFDCVFCHSKPATIIDSGHLGADSLAEVVWHGISGTAGVWNRTARTCSNTYCHGNFTGGKTANTPIWTASNQSACGSCHDVGTNPASLQWKHELHIISLGLKCADCHASVVDEQLNISSKSLHVNGVVDTLTRDPALCSLCHGPGEGSCVTCHGGIDNQTGAPPKGLRGETSTGQIAVGAHTAHSEAGSVANAFDCNQCHIKPTEVADPGHFALDSLAEIIWGGIAGSGSQWNRAAKTCTNTYCHGNFTGGTKANAPIWTSPNQATCGSCHDVGSNPANLEWEHALHVASFELKCADCHANVVDTLLQVTNKALHVNGVVDTLTRDPAVCDVCHGPNPSCTRCHGGIENQTGAPPKGLRGETLTSQVAVGAHTSHVSVGTVANAYDCNQCHVKPTKIADPGHIGPDSLAEVIWGGIAGSSSQWNRTTKTCSSTYCHGNFAGGSPSNAPVWTSPNQATCGSCHDVGTNPASLQWKHELHVTSFGLKCADCHANVVDTLLQVNNKALHVNGVVDTLTRDPVLCNLCHGPGQGSCATCHGGIDNQTGAPPKGLRGETLTTQLAVGAHTAHVQTAAIAGAYDCNQCHIKPTQIASPGHFGLDSLAEVIWGGIAGSSSQWNRSAKACSNTYCHGNFAGGSTSNAPVWTSPNQATCGSCHDVGTNPASLQWKHELHITSFGLKCADCHANVVDQQLNLTGKNLHVNGVVDTLTRDPAICNVCHGPGQGSCATCHGGIDNQTGAPPKGLRGETLTTQLAVGAHTAHVQTAAIASAYDCNQCHIKPTTIASPGHFALDSLAEVIWDGIAGASSQWNRNTKTCSSTYCHGNFVGGYIPNAPVWTANTQAHCGSCHDIGVEPASLLWKHEVHVTTYGLQCADCHANVIDQQLNLIGKNLHVNGVVDTLTRDPAVCNLCHGTGPDRCILCHGGIDNQTGAPPKGLRGETSTTTIAVGAHTAHVQTGPLANALDCTLCHNKPVNVIDAGHLGPDSIAEVVWHGISGASGVWNRSGKTCSSTYCHGNFTGGKTTNTPIWTASNQASCGSCHDVGTNPSLLRGEHKKHVQEENIICQRCHASTVDTIPAIIGKALHINSVNNVNFYPNTGSYSNGTCSNPAGCHGTEHW